MFRHMFAVMNEVLDDIIREYPAASPARRRHLDEQLEMLKGLGDMVMEEWLVFEEKWSRAKQQTSEANGGLPLMLPTDDEHMAKGHGYFQLMMYNEAIREFELAVAKNPDALQARLLLALCHLENRNHAEAYRHFQFLLPLTEDGKIKAVTYNAMGCIQAVQSNMEKACELFRLAYESDPTLQEPLVNMAVCLNNKGSLQLGPGITGLFSN